MGQSAMKIGGNGIRVFKKRDLDIEYTLKWNKIQIESESFKCSMNQADMQVRYITNNLLWLHPYLKWSKWRTTALADRLYTVWAVTLTRQQYFSNTKCCCKHCVFSLLVKACRWTVRDDNSCLFMHSFCYSSFSLDRLSVCDHRAATGWIFLVGGLFSTQPWYRGV